MNRVTGKNAYHDPLMDDGKTTRFAQWRRGLSPHSHVLVKAVGDTISASWTVTNTGGIAAFGFLEIFFPATGGAFQGGTPVIAAGATATLTVSGVLGPIAPGTYPGQVRVRALAPATVAPGGTHDFTLTISAPLGAVLTADPAGPSIT